MQVTMEIRDHYPELTKFLEEMPVIVPDGKDMGITLKSLKSYYDSLNSILNDYSHRIQNRSIFKMNLPAAS